VKRLVHSRALLLILVAALQFAQEKGQVPGVVLTVPVHRPDIEAPGGLEAGLQGRGLSAVGSDVNRPEVAVACGPILDHWSGPVLGSVVHQDAFPGGDGVGVFRQDLKQLAADAIDATALVIKGDNETEERC
jgi:hypothetical protein